MKYLCIIQARINSSRLPSKVMLDVAGKTLLERVYNTVSKSKKINKIIVATSNYQQDNIIDLKLKKLGIDCFRGDLNNVLKRFYDAAEIFSPENIVRVTADNPMMDFKVIDDLIAHYEKSNCDYSTFLGGVYGLSAEVFSRHALRIAYENSRNDYEKEHVTPYMKSNCMVSNVEIDPEYRHPNIRASIDTLEDYIKMQDFYLVCQEESIDSNIVNYISYISDSK